MKATGQRWQHSAFSTDIACELESTAISAGRYFTPRINNFVLLFFVTSAIAAIVFRMNDYQQTSRSSSSSYVLHRKLAIIGDRHVGKSSLAEQFVTGRFIENYDPTIENTLRKSIGFRGSPFSVEIVDTAGSDEYSRLSRNATVGVHGYILVYSVASRASMEKLRNVNKMLFNMIGNPPGIPRVLVATMLDASDQRTVSYSQGAALAAEFKIPFIECSSKTGENIGEAFSLLLSEVEKENPSEPVDTFAQPDCIIA